MPNMSLSHKRQMASLILQGMLSDSTELKETVVDFHLTPKQLKMLDEVMDNIKQVRVLHTRS